MLDFDVKKCTRRCAATDAELQPGDAYYSVLEAAGAEVVRRDYSVAAWQGPPAGALGWWKSRIPTDADHKPVLAPSGVALELFDRWCERPERREAVYVLALLLVRKRVFRFSESPFDADDRGRFRLHCPTRAAEYEVDVVEVDSQRAAEIQDELVGLLYTDAA